MVHLIAVYYILEVSIVTGQDHGTKHDGERYELHLCEGCFFLTIANLKEERRIQNLISDDAVSSMPTGELGLVEKDDYFRD